MNDHCLILNYLTSIAQYYVGYRESNGLAVLMPVSRLMDVAHPEHLNV